MLDAIVDVLRAVDIDGIWRPIAIFGSIGYAVILGGVIIKGVRQARGLETPNPTPGFYLAQAYLAFMWPLPLFLVVEWLDTLAIWSS